MRCGSSWFDALAVCALTLLWLGCNSYRSEVLGSLDPCGDGQVSAWETCDTAIAADEPGACPRDCRATDPCKPQTLRGGACQARCIEEVIEHFTAGDGCCPEGAAPPDDSDCNGCGNGQLEPGERCDPPASCPNASTCRSPDPCIRAVVVGNASACKAHCELEPVSECGPQDACCPSGCGAERDDDCPVGVVDMCGDGELDTDAGERCDPSVPDAPCVTPADCDDGDPCTDDRFAGSGDACDAGCVHDPVTRPRDGDGCCPGTLQRSDDDDCPEPAAPDAGAGTTLDAGPPAPPPPPSMPSAAERCQQRLRTSDAPASEACSQCVCERCLDAMLECYDSGDPERDARCAAIMDCKQRVGCTGDDCYCGSSVGCIIPDGPCAEPIVAASGDTSLTQCVADPNCANYRSTRYTECLEDTCTSACR